MTELRVLARPAFANHSVNPYNAILYRSVRRQGVRVDEFSVARWLFGEYDVLHVHWPESVFNHSLGPALVTTKGLLAAMDRVKRRGTRVLWTIHNLRAHERRHRRHEEAFWDAFIPRLDGFIALTETSRRAAVACFELLSRKPGFVVPHPHYRGIYPDTVDRRAARLALGLPPSARIALFLGKVLAYKDVPVLVRAARRIAREDTYLVVAGEPRTRALWQSAVAAAGDDSRIVLHPGHVANDRIQLYLRAADLVALPYREILNSGAAILAASFDRPVLLPRAGAGAELEALLGQDWVTAYDGAFTEEVLDGALDRARSLPERTGGAHLAALDPERVGRLSVSAFAALRA